MDCEIPILSAEEMQRVERISIREGASEEEYVSRAGLEVAEAALRLLEQKALPETVSLMVGKGNNGADALSAGVYLTEKGINVRAFLFYPSEESSPLCATYAKRFAHAGGRLNIIEEPSSYFAHEKPEGLIIDGLLGVGLRGRLHEKTEVIIRAVNALSSPVLSVDIPSGVNGSTGVVDPVAVKATETVFLGALKIGGFIRDGYEQTGAFSVASFGLEERYLRMARATACMFDEKSIARMLPPVIRTRHKYRTGYLLAVAGSRGMTGAALLSSFAALRSGAGIVRLFHPAGTGGESVNVPWELIRSPYDNDPGPFFRELRRASAVMVGPGMGRGEMAEKFVREITPAIRIPMLIDADALFLLRDSLSSLNAPAVLTPHRGEMLSLLDKPEYGDILAECGEWATSVGHIVVVKGAPTFIFRPDALPLIVPSGDPGMATAGTGDVLSGVIAALLAQKAPPIDAATLGVYLHGYAGEQVARKMTSYGMVASDLIEALPGAFKHLE
ncbi:MAG: NAD(P)H-hydrate dehydratase [Simkaniaceae bacterium]|nr:NAD(P)H-hydrate dehydratase [Simkaniaceae bacterium]